MFRAAASSPMRMMSMQSGHAVGGEALPLPFAAVRWVHAAVGIGRQASDGRLCAGSCQVTPPAVRVQRRLRPTDRPKDSTSRQAYEESDPADDVSHILTGLRCGPYLNVQGTKPPSSSVPLLLADSLLDAAFARSTANFSVYLPSSHRF
jgi:hypothetical protein